MDRWNKFLSSLATRGGAIFVLLVLSGAGFAITLHIIHAGEDTSMVAAGLVTTLGNFTGALLLALKGSSESSATASVSPEGVTKVSAGDSAAVSTSAPSTTETKGD